MDEFGTHDELMEKRGFYYNLVNAQYAKKASAKSLVNADRNELTIEHKQEADALSTVVLELEQNPEPSSDVSFYRIFKENFPEWPWLTLSAVACVLSGCIVPAFAFLYGESFHVREISCPFTGSNFITGFSTGKRRASILRHALGTPFYWIGCYGSWFAKSYGRCYDKCFGKTTLAVEDRSF